jgi:uncharacterized protein HemX
MNQETTSPNSSKPQNRLGIAAVVLACLALIVALGTLFLTIQNWLEQNKLQLLPTTIPQLVKDTTRDSIESALHPINAQLTSQQQSIQSLQHALAQSNGPIQLAHAKVLVNLARLSQQAGSQPQVTLALLQQAKQKLNPNQDKTLIADINKDITYLQKDAKTNAGKELNRLSQARQLVATLQAQSPNTQALHPQERATHWYQRWWQNFQALFVVQRISNSNKRLLTPDQADLIKAALTLQLDTASWALLQNNQTLLKQSLTQAVQLSSEGFKPSPQLKQLNQLLNQLIAMPAQPTYQLLSYQLINH